MGFLDFSALITKIAAAAKTEGIELSQEEIDKAVKKLSAAQDFLNEHGLQENEGAEGRFGSSPPMSSSVVVTDFAAASMPLANWPRSVATLSSERAMMP